MRSLVFHICILVSLAWALTLTLECSGGYANEITLPRPELVDIQQTEFLW
jgi:hypothetical protein